MTLADIIEHTYGRWWKNRTPTVEIVRSNLATLFCVPSQINYVLTTVHPERGFLVESRRGGAVMWHHALQFADRQKVTGSANLQLYPQNDSKAFHICDA
jgi:transcriptional regulator CtsR